MGEVVPFPPPGGKKKKSTGKTLCRRGFHKWAVDKERRFDVKQGRLVTIERCTRCGHTRTTLA
ncbi:MAG: hypothetical protein ACU85V_02380 [Gammaproteobacteria bacterium]